MCDDKKSVCKGEYAAGAAVRGEAYDGAENAGGEQGEAEEGGETKDRGGMTGVRLEVDEPDFDRISLGLTEPETYFSSTSHAAKEDSCWIIRNGGWQ